MYSMQGAKIELHGNRTREYVPQSKVVSYYDIPLSLGS